MLRKLFKNSKQNEKLFKLAGGLAVSFALFSCSTTQNTTTRSAVTLPGITMERSDYELTDDIEASAEVKVTLNMFY